MNFGLGKVMYLSGDASWRLRQVQGINYHERLWGQAIRWVMESQLPAGGQFVRFGSDKPRYVGGEQTIVTAKVVDKNLKPIRGLKVRVQARVLSDTGKTDPTAKPLVEVDMADVDGAPGRYIATLNNLPAGTVELTLHGPEVDLLLKDDPKAQQKALNVEVVKNLNLEMKNVNADFHRLASLSADGGGVALSAAYADLLADHLPELTYTTTEARQIGLFTEPKENAQISHWIFLALFVTLITAEWIIRKAAGLV
jgi:hypothetical protein